MLDTARIHVSDLICALRAIPPGNYGPHNAGRILHEARLDGMSIAPYVNFEAGRYTRNLIYRNQWFELLALCWDDTASTAIHDHGGEQCWAVPHIGVFRIDDYRLIAGGREPGFAVIEHVATSTVTSGQLDYRAPDDALHKISIVPSSARAISIHFYAKPVANCLVFDMQSNSCSKRILSYDTTGPREFA